jgi:hypothetical protein
MGFWLPLLSLDIVAYDPIVIVVTGFKKIEFPVF